MESIFTAIITKEMAALAAAAIAIMLFIGRIPFKGAQVSNTAFWHNWGIFILVAICLAGSFTPGIHNIPLSEWGSVLVFAMVASMVSLLARASLKPFILTRLERKLPNSRDAPTQFASAEVADAITRLKSDKPAHCAKQPID